MKKISLPKIGIRPVIDGRRMGVRESLEEQTMNMAKATRRSSPRKSDTPVGLRWSASLRIPVLPEWRNPPPVKKNSVARTWA